MSAFAHGWNEGDLDSEAWHEGVWPDEDLPDPIEVAEDQELKEQAERKGRRR